MIKMLGNMLRNDDGATMVEYGVIVALIAAVCIGVVAIIGGKIGGAFSSVNSQL